MAQSSNQGQNTKLYMEWIHCNRCYELYVYKKRTLYLLAGCYHVICAQCTQEIRQPEINGRISFMCPLCLKLARGCAIGNSMPSNLKLLFHPEPWSDGLNTAQIMQFQTKHRQRILKYIERKGRIANEIEEGVRKIQGNCRKLYQELREMKAKRKYFEKRILMMKQNERQMELNAQHVRASQQITTSHISSSTSETGYRYMRPQNRTVSASSFNFNPPALIQPRMPPPTNPDAVFSFQLNTINNNSFYL